LADLVQYQQKDLHQKEEVRGGVEKWKNICAKSLLKHNQEFLIVTWPYCYIVEVAMLMANIFSLSLKPS